MSRDVDRADWTAFGKALLGRRRSGPAAADNDQNQDVEVDEAARRERISSIVSQWNRDFFAPRGLQILAQFGDDVVEVPSAKGEEGTTAVADGDATSNGSTSKSQGFGLKLGNSMLGVSLPPHSHGYGLRLGGVLLGLRVDDDGDAK